MFEHIMTGTFNHNQSGEYFPFILNVGHLGLFCSGRHIQKRNDLAVALLLLTH